MNNPLLTAIILTYNEEIHLQRCLDSLKEICDQIIVIDSYSTDDTEKIAIRNGVRFVQNKWINYASQFNWALESQNISTDWILRIDADEYLTEQLKQEINLRLPLLDSNISGILLPLQRIFMNRRLKKGYNEIKLLRLFRNGKGRSENRWMDEHIVLSEGMTMEFKNGFVDHNLNSLTWWTNKHNNYSIREAVDLLDIELNLLNINVDQYELTAQAAQKRNLKLKYSKQPIFIRAFYYFLYRYFFRFGFTEGKEGFIWHFLQGWWYRTLVDAKIYEIKKACGQDKELIKKYLKIHYDLQIN